jgi:uncharacterized membrane protein
MSARLDSAVLRSGYARIHRRARISRVPSIDILRGLAMVLMALDHVRDFFTDAHFDPLDLAQTTAPLFLTRWITHFLRADVRAARGSQRAISCRDVATRAELSRFLLTRGLWLVVLEVTLMSLVWTFNVRYDHGLFLQVIWALGVSMIVLAALVHLPWEKSRVQPVDHLRAQPAR